MDPENPLEDLVPFPITRYREEQLMAEQSPVAVEIPLTFVVNGHEMATLMCSPSHPKAFTYGFLFTSGMIRSAKDILDWDLDQRKWRVDVQVKEFTDPELLGKRIYTSGCGKGVMYTNMAELAARSDPKSGSPAGILSMPWDGWPDVPPSIKKPGGSIPWLSASTVHCLNFILTISAVIMPWTRSSAPC